MPSRLPLVPQNGGYLSGGKRSPMSQLRVSAIVITRFGIVISRFGS
jgi:hypothetical protein